MADVWTGEWLAKSIGTGGGLSHMQLPHEFESTFSLLDNMIPSLSTPPLALYYDHTRHGSAFIERRLRIRFG